MNEPTLGSKGWKLGKLKGSMGLPKEGRDCKRGSIPC